MRRSGHTKPEPVMAGVGRPRRNVPGFMGFRMVRCEGCGARGPANRGLIGKRQWTIPHCRECR